MKTFLTLYFLYLLANMLVGVPENHVSAGVHQTVGPCNVTDVDLAGHSRQVSVLGQHTGRVIHWIVHQ